MRAPRPYTIHGNPDVPPGLCSPVHDEMVIFSRTYDLLTWLIPKSERFPMAQRFAVTKRLQDAALDFQEHLIEANALEPGKARARKLREAALHKLRLYLRLAHRWKWLNDGAYEHVSKMVAEIGRRPAFPT